MRLETYLIMEKNMKNSMFGFGVEESRLRRISVYVKSWLDRYNINYKEIGDYHFTIAQIKGTYSKDQLVIELNSIDKDIRFYPREMKLFQGKLTKKDYIVIEYKPNYDFIKLFNEISSEYDVRYFEGIKPHISLFSLEPGSINSKVMADMLYSLPKLPIIKPDYKQLWNKDFEVEYKEE